MLINNFSSFVAEDIICTFESGTCDWKITSYGPNEEFKWDLCGVYDGELHDHLWDVPK